MNNWATSVRLTQILGRKEHRDQHLVNCVVSFSQPSNSDHGGPAKQRICIFPGSVFSSNIWHQGLCIVQWKKLDMLMRWRSTDHLSISTRTCQASLVSTRLLLLHPKQEKKSRMTCTVRAPEISRTHLLFSSPCATVLHFTILGPTALNWKGARSWMHLPCIQRSDQKRDSLNTNTTHPQMCSATLSTTSILGTADTGGYSRSSMHGEIGL